MLLYALPRTASQGGSLEWTYYIIFRRGRELRRYWRNFYDSFTVGGMNFLNFCL